MKKIVVVITHYDREKQLCKTLKSIEQTTHKFYHIVIVDDASPKPLHIPVDTYIDIIHIDPSTKKWSGPVVPFNIGIAYALTLKPDIIMMQNAECYHVGDVLMYANDHVTDNRWVSFACWNLEKEFTGTDYDIFDVIEKRRVSPNLCAGTGWYNHPINPRLFHFCNAMSANTMKALNGMDERFKDGVGYDDDDLVRRLLKLIPHYILTDETKPFVVHQWHDRSYQDEKKYQKNRELYNHMPKDNYRAQHLITEDFK